MLVDVLYSCMYLIIYCNLEISFDHLVPQILFVLNYYNSIFHYCSMKPDHRTGKALQHIQFEACDVNEFEYKLNM